MFKQDWVIGSGAPPPKWLLKEFKRALTLMGKNREVVHVFDTGQRPDRCFSFIIAIAPTRSSEELSRKIAEVIGASPQAVVDSTDAAAVAAAKAPPGEGTP
jgi:hypothetical protein